MKTKNRIIQLIQELNKLNYHYYSLNESLVTDEYYDKLLNELKDLENKFPHYIFPDSPTKKVGENISNRNKSQHLRKMFSLENAFNEIELINWNNRIENRLLKPISFIVEYKIDGLSLSLTYKNNKLTKALTRGDGDYGEDVTENIKNIASIPKQINSNYEEIEVRGEVILLNSNFLEYQNAFSSANEQILKKNEELNKNILLKKIPSNPRNSTAGLIRDIHSEKLTNNKVTNFLNEIKQNTIKKLTFFAYDIEPKNLIQETLQSKIMNSLKENSFNVQPNYAICKDITAVKKAINTQLNNIDNLDFEVDGSVIKVDSIELQNYLGNTSKFPKWAIAYKFPVKEVETKMQDIFVTIGRTGKVTYNAKLKKIFVDGSFISRATLHNYDYIQKKDIRINDIVKIKKAGGIIPKVTSVVQAKRPNNSTIFKEITICPICNSSLVKIKPDVDQYCINKSCPAIIRASLEYFVSKDAMDIQGLGSSIIELTLEHKIINNIEDIYKLAENKEMQIKLLKALKGKRNPDLEFKSEDIEQSLTIKNLIKAINDSKKKPLENLLTGLGIKYCGKKTAKILANKFETMDNLIKVTKTALLSINAIGETTMDSIFAFFHNQENINTIEKLKKYDLNMNQSKQEYKKSIFFNKKVVITGKLNTPRDKLIRKLESEYGALVSNSVTKNTSFLILGTDPGSKFKKAQSLGVKIIKEIELSNFI